MTEKRSTTTPMGRPDREPRALPAILGILLPTLAGAGMGAVLIFFVLIPWFGIGSTQRSLCLGRHLDQPYPQDRPTVVCLGSSLIVAGVDANLIEAQTPPWRAENLSVGGCVLTEMRLLIPKVMTTRPQAVVLVFLANDLRALGDIHLDKAYAYKLGGFMEAWPADWSAEDLPGYGPDTLEALRATPLDAWWHFRGAHLQVANDSIIGLLKGGIWNTPVRNWKSPSEREQIITGESLTHHLTRVREDWEKQLASPSRQGELAIRRLVAQIAAGGARPILLIPPVHPRLRSAPSEENRELAKLLTRLAREHDGIFGDASALVEATGFADAVHLQARGREIFSRFIGKLLKKLPETNRERR